MTLLIYIHFASVVAYVYFFGFLTAQRVNDPVNRALRLFVLTAFGWAFVELLLYMPFAYGNELFLKRLTSFFWAPLTFTFLRFLYVLLDRKKDWIYYTLAVGAAISAGVGLTSDLGFADCVRHDWGILNVPGPLHRYMTLFPALTGLTAVTIGLVSPLKSSSRKLVRPLRLIVIGAILSLGAGFTTHLVLPDFLGMVNAPKLGFACTIPLFVAIHRAIVRHKFLAVDVEQLAEEIFESLHDAVVLVDRTGAVRRMNSAARKLFAVDPSAIYDLNAKDILGQYDPDTQISEKEVCIEHGDQKFFSMLSSSPNLRGGMVVGQLLILRDITAQKAADELLEFRKERLQQEVERQRLELRQARKAERVGIAAGVIAHDFNNLLVGIIAYSGLAIEELPKDSPLLSDFEEILKAGRRARDIVSHILVFSRRGEEKWELVSLKDELLETVKLLDISLPVNIELELKVDEDIGQVFAAPTRLRQIVMNISTNAYQAMKKDGGRLTVALTKNVLTSEFISEHRLSQKGPYAEITIADTGVGLSKEKIQKMFEPFYTTKEQEEGTGLGLSTALRVASEIGGVIVGEGEVGVGSTFKIYLPLWESPAGELTKATSTCSILVVDDDETVGIHCKRLLEPLGHELRTYLSPTEALDDFEDNPKQFDILITDQRMPEMLGTELAKQMREIRPDFPVILISSNSPSTFKSEADELGIDQILQKPMDQDKLQSAIEQVLEKSNRSDLNNGETR